ncbi:hypothetical protein EHH54_10410 [Rhizobium leguminosarum]|uniref:hypothetical protein n=1 Tax=Rhizobium leguminosarum TaxID=384 RepID=UPI000FEC63D3|nr:hypothetical protein [Rhizobium leguminosarum]RWX40813.1 hypothetical protein EHH54_10410 [Rhizobium leguminosarum]
MTKTVHLPPLTDTPLDYAPIDVPADGHVPEHDVDRNGHKRGSKKYRPWNDPDHFFTFRAPIFRRAAIAAASFGGAVGALLLFPVATIAIVAMVGSVWATDKAIKRFDKDD